MELVAPAPNGDSPPAKSEELPEALLVRTLAQLAPEGNFSLRYLYDPQRPGELQVALLGRVGGEDVQETLGGLQRFLEVTFKDHRFEPLGPGEVQRFLSPFLLNEVVEITRQMVALNTASWEIVPQTPLGFAASDGERASTNGRAEAKKVVQELSPYVLPFLPHEEGWARLGETLLLQPGPYMLEIALWPTELPQETIQLLEGEVERYERYLRGRSLPGPQGEGEARLSTVLTLRAELLRDWFLIQKHRLEAPGNAFWVRIRLASPGTIPPELIAMTGQALSRPMRVSVEGGRGYYLAGGYDHFHYHGAPQELHRAITKLGRDLWAVHQEPFRYIFSGQAAGEVFRLPRVLSQGQAGFPGLRVRHARYLEAPEGLPLEGIRLGHAHRRGQEVAVHLKTDDHRRHLYAIGQTGVGKSSLLLKMALENIRRGEGVAVIDPHGDLIQLLLDRIPEERLEDTILLDPGDPNYAVGLNLLEWQLEEERAFLVDELIAMLRLLYSPEIIGPMFEHNVRYGLLLLMANPDEPGTLVEFPHLFSDKEFHQRWLPYLEDPLVRRFWEVEFPHVNYKSDQYLQYIVSKFDPFITHPLMRRIIGQRRSTLDLEAIMNEGKILLVDLAKGKLGELNSKMLGMIMIAKLYSAAMRRIKVPRSQRRDFFVYVDEFQNLATETFTSILSEARKFRLNLTLCNQYIAQLPYWIVQALLGNVGTLIAFRVGVHDAELLEDHFETLGRQALAEQPNYHAYARLLVEGRLTPPFSFWTELEPEEGGERARERIIAGRRGYARPRVEVEAEIARGLDQKEDR